MFKYDRCPTCKGQMIFYGITKDQRWLECRHCAIYFGRDLKDGMVYQSRKAPPVMALPPERKTYERDDADTFR